MKILAARIDWRHQWSNVPELNVLVDRLPDVSELRFVEKNGLYLSVWDGLCTFFANPRTGGASGYAQVTMEDGTVLHSMFGAWASRAGAVVWAHGVRCVDVSLTDDPDRFHKQQLALRSGALTVERTLEALALCGEQAYLLDVPDYVGERTFIVSSSPIVTAKPTSVARYDERPGTAVTQ